MQAGSLAAGGNLEYGGRSLDAASYPRPMDVGAFLNIPVELQKPIKEQLAAISGLPAQVVVDQSKNPLQIGSRQPLSALRWIYTQLGRLFEANPGAFPDGASGPYFSKGAQSLHPFGSDVFADIVKHLEAGTSVFVDYSNAPEEVAQNLSERIASRVFATMVNLLSMGQLGSKFVVIYFEEAHRLFRSDDKDLTSIYNRLAKEGAKFHIAMVYATQSMTTLSPDLLKNTENFIIAHLNDDREVREVTRRYEFRDIADDVQRIRSKGFVRMITLSHQFALPVQLDHSFPRRRVRDSEVAYAKGGYPVEAASKIGHLKIVGSLLQSGISLRALRHRPPATHHSSPKAWRKLIHQFPRRCNMSLRLTGVRRWCRTKFAAKRPWPFCRRLPAY